MPKQHIKKEKARKEKKIEFLASVPFQRRREETGEIRDISVLAQRRHRLTPKKSRERRAFVRAASIEVRERRKVCLTNERIFASVAGT